MSTQKGDSVDLNLSKEKNKIKINRIANRKKFLLLNGTLEYSINAFTTNPNLVKDFVCHIKK